MTASNDQSQQPSIALVTPCAAEDVVFVSQLLRSVNYQTRLPTEMIISISGIDAESALKWERKWQSELNERVPLFVLHKPESAYAGPNRQQGAELTRSEVVSFFDVDDVQAPERLESIANAFKDERVKAAFHRFTIQDVDHYPEAEENAWFKGAPGMYHRGWISVRRDVIRRIAWGNEPRAQEFKYLEKFIDVFGKQSIAFLPMKLGHYICTGFKNQEQHIDFKIKAMRRKLCSYSNGVKDTDDQDSQGSTY